MRISRERAAEIICSQIPSVENTKFGRKFLNDLVDGKVEFDGEFNSIIAITNFVRAGVKKSTILIPKDLLLEA